MTAERHTKQSTVGAPVPEEKQGRPRTTQDPEKPAGEEAAGALKNLSLVTRQSSGHTPHSACGAVPAAADSQLGRWDGDTPTTLPADAQAAAAQLEHLHLQEAAMVPGPVLGSHAGGAAAERSPVTSWHSNVQSPPLTILCCYAWIQAPEPGLPSQQGPLAPPWHDLAELLGIHDLPPLATYTQAHVAEPVHLATVGPSPRVVTIAPGTWGALRLGSDAHFHIIMQSNPYLVFFRHQAHPRLCLYPLHSLTAPGAVRFASSDP